MCPLMNKSNDGVLHKTSALLEVYLSVTEMRGMYLSVFHSLIGKSTLVKI